MVVAIPGSSLTTGYLSANWVPQLTREAQSYPEAKGPVRILDLGKGGRTSLDGLAQAPLITGLRPTHILTEGYAINDCFDTGGGPAVSPATHIADIQGFVNQWLAGIPGVDITIQTMSSVSSYQTARTALASYYADELTTAAGLGVNTLPNFNGVVGGPSGGWPKPLDGHLTNGAVPFVLPVTPGYGSIGGGDYWARLGLSLTTSADGLTLFSTSGGYTTAVSANPISGLIHFELRGIFGSDCVFGVGNVSTDLGNFIGRDGNSIGYFANGDVHAGGGVAVTYAPYISGQTIGVEIDAVNKLIYFINGGVRYGPVGIGYISGTIYPAATLYQTATTFGAGLTDLGDGLHPIYAGAVDTYLYPNVKAWLRAKMAAFWP